MGGEEARTGEAPLPPKPVKLTRTRSLREVAAVPPAGSALRRLAPLPLPLLALNFYGGIFFSYL